MERSGNPKLRVGFFESDDFAPATRETAAAVRRAAEALKQHGFQVEEWRPENLDQVWKLWWNLFGRAGQMAFAPLLAGRDDEMSPLLKEFRAYVAQEPPLGADELLDTLLQRDDLRTKFLAKMESFSILICPVCAIPAFRHGERKWSIKEREIEYLRAMAYSQWFDLLEIQPQSCPSADRTTDCRSGCRSWTALGRGSGSCGSRQD